MAKKNESALDRLIKKFTNATPIENESSVKLDHDFDGIQELNNPLPPWWTIGFIITVIIALVYTGFYFANYYDVNKVGKWQEMELNNEMAKADQQVKEYLKAHPFAPKLITSKNKLEEGKILFEGKCAACHRKDAGGLVGPNLTDDQWLYGCDVADLFKTVKNGTKKGMPPFGKELNRKQIEVVASYVISLRGTKPANPKPAEGEACSK